MISTIVGVGFEGKKTVGWTSSQQSPWLYIENSFSKIIEIDTANDIVLTYEILDC